MKPRTPPVETVIEINRAARRRRRAFLKHEVDKALRPDVHGALERRMSQAVAQDYRCDCPNCKEDRYGM